MPFPTSPTAQNTTADLVASEGKEESLRTTLNLPADPPKVKTSFSVDNMDVAPVMIEDGTTYFILNRHARCT
jgi:hypothetical protein